VRCIRSLGLYVACSDCFISFFHPEYWNRAFCLVEQMFGDAVRLPRYVLQLDGQLEPLDTGEILRQQLVDPIKGDLTVESDRPTVNVLKLVAIHMRCRLWFGQNSRDCSLYQLEQAIEQADEDVSTTQEARTDSPSDEEAVSADSLSQNATRAASPILQPTEDVPCPVTKAEAGATHGGSSGWWYKSVATFAEASATYGGSARWSVR